MIECPTCHAVPSKSEKREPGRDLAEGGQINDIGSRKSRFGPVAGGKEKGNRIATAEHVGSILGLPIDGPKGVQLALV